MGRLILLLAALALYAEDPAMLARDAKDARAIQHLRSQMSDLQVRATGELRVMQSQVDAILAKYAASHNCPSSKAAMEGALIACVPLPAPPKPDPGEKQ